MGETRPQPAGETHNPDSLPVSSQASLMLNFSLRNIANECNELCNIACDLKFNGDFKIFNTEDDGCTVKTCLVN